MRRIVRSPLFSAGYTLLGLVAGLLGSVHGADVARAFPLRCCDFGGIAWGAVAFWSAAGGTAAMFVIQQRVREEDRREAEERMRARAGELETLVRTMPPPDFLPFFAEVYTRCAAARRIALTRGADEEDRARAIRYVLEGVALLARRFDRAEDTDVRYAANLMVYRPQECITEEALPGLERRMRFMERGVGVRSLRGVLDLRCEHSAFAEGTDPDAEPDPHLREIVLPVQAPEDERTRIVCDGESMLRWRVLPGAPMAFVRGELEVYTDVEDMVRWCEQQGDFSREVVQAIRDHFRSASEHGSVSFASFPLFGPGGAGTPVAVLNVHRNAPGLLRERKLAAQFAALLEPFGGMLAELLADDGTRALPLPYEGA